MTLVTKAHLVAALLAASLLLGASQDTQAGGSASGGPVSQATPVDSNPWELEFRPYGWVLFITGDSTLGANTTDIDTNVFEIIEDSDQLYAFMSYQELRKGRLGLYADVVWTKINVGTSTVRGSNPIAGLNATLVADADIWFDLAIVEPGVAYEIANRSWGAGSLKDPHAFAPATAVDLVAGARYWWLRPDIDLNVTATVNIPALGLTRSGGGTISAKQTFDWWDPFIGLRLRHQMAPGQKLVLEADVGGFDAGSDFSWQAAAGYSSETRLLGVPMTSYLGYRALYIDYQQGSGGRTFALDTLWHGPVLGVSFNW